MKYKIRKMADGGGFATFTPIEASRPNVASNTTSNSEDAKTDKGNSVVDEKMLEYLYKTGGLVNDVNKLVSELIQLEKTSALPYLKQKNRSDALRIAAKINEITQNKANWDSSISRAKEQGGLGEVAVDTYGRVFAMDENKKISAMSLAEYDKQRNNTKLLSVQELMYERQYNASLTGQNGVFTVADNAIGLTKITNQIKGLIEALGTESSENTSFYSKDQAKAYLKGMGGKAPNAQEKEAINLLNEVINSPGKYAEVKTKRSSERNRIDKALNYIWSTLGEPAQQKLTAVSVIEGNKNPKELILDMLEAGTNYSEETSVIPKEKIDGSGSGSGDDPKNISWTPQELFHNDRLYKPGMTYTINNPTAKVQMNVTATGIGPLYSLTKPGEVLEAGTLNKVLTNDNYKAILDPSKAYIGDTKVPAPYLGEVAYTGEDVAKVYLPVRNDGSPDLAQMEKFNDAYEVFDINKDNWSVQELENYFKKAGFSGVQVKEVIGSDGTKTKIIGESGKVRPFLAMPIITNSASDLSDNPWMTEMVGDKKEAAEYLMEQAFTVMGGTPSKPSAKNVMPSKTWSLETPYQGVMFVAYRPEASGIITSMQGHLTGKAPSDVDLYRNLNFTSQTSPTGYQASARVLK